MHKTAATHIDTLFPFSFFVCVFFFFLVLFGQLDWYVVVGFVFFFRGGGGGMGGGWGVFVLVEFLFWRVHACFFVVVFLFCFCITVCFVFIVFSCFIWAWVHQLSISMRNLFQSFDFEFMSVWLLVYLPLKTYLPNHIFCQCLFSIFTLFCLCVVKMNRNCASFSYASKHKCCRLLRLMLLNLYRDHGNKESIVHFWFVLFCFFFSFLYKTY